MATSSGTEQWDRLQEEQVLAIQQSKERINLLENYKKDYESLRERLTTLPDKVRHDVMVPFGPLAFMPGKLVHTNELLVLLGDNWFAERSAKQAADIVTRRIQGIDDQLVDFEKQKDLLEPRLQFTQELQKQGQNDIVEIKEEFDEEKEKQWKEKHRKHVSEYRRRTKSAKTAHQGSGDANQPIREGSGDAGQPIREDEDLWRRLDELQIQERRGREMEKLSTEEDTVLAPEFISKAETRIKWHDQQQEDTDDSEEDDEEEDSDEDEGEEDEEEEENSEKDDDVVDPRRPTTIQFQHTNKHTQAGGGAASAGSDSITSPADIYRQFYKPTSILKPSSSSHHSQVEPLNQRQHVTPESDHPMQQAFSGTVVERDVVATETTASQPAKKMSKFKQMRMQQSNR